MNTSRARRARSGRRESVARDGGPFRRVAAAAAAATALGVAAAGFADDGGAPSAPRQAPPPEPLDVSGFWTEDELRRIDAGLDLVNASRADLGFAKRPIDDPFRLDVVNRALDDPLSMGREAATWDAMARSGDAGDLLLYAAVTLHGTAGASSGVAHEFPNVLAAVPEPAREALADLLRHVHWAKHKLTTKGANHFGDDAELRRRVLEKALRSQVEAPSGEKPADLLDDDAFLTEVRKVERKWLVTHGRNVESAVAALVAALRGLPADARPSQTVVVTDVATFGIPIRVVIGGTGGDVHAGADADVVIDFGGDDTYTRGASANLLEGRAVSVVIDLAGDDRYVGAHDLSFGGALGGVAVQWDCAGDDTYRGGHVALGAGILGVGVLVDEGGDDVFRSKDFGQGAGAHGVGVFLEKGGNDLYHADLHGQGFASVSGCGVLADLGGNDVYDAGGVHLHAPLYRDRCLALSQGFAIGARPGASGGVGVLVDVSGNDRYQTDIYGQGASYWYALGLLIDGGGHDTYQGTHYCQGTGIHLSAGMLLDRGGNDAYHCLNGVGVGGSHDFAAGILLDRGGDDHYSGSGASQGCGHTNGVGILLDGGGDDGYCAVRGLSQGDASVVRGSGGIGLLLDAAGSDVYSETTRDGGVWTRGAVGGGIDAPSPPAPPAGPQAPVVSPEAAARVVEERCSSVADGVRVWDIDRLWALASEWAVNDNSVIVPVARERFCALGEAAVDRAFDRLRSTGGNGLEYEAVQDVMKRFAATERRDALVARLLVSTRDGDPLVRRGAVGVLGALRAAEAEDRLVEMLEADPPHRRQVLGALGALGRAPEPVRAYLRSGTEIEGVNAAICLAAAGDDASLAALAGSLGGDTRFLVRTAAVEQLAGLGAKSVPVLAGVAADRQRDERARRNAVRALGRTRSDAAVPPILAALDAAEPLVRLTACAAADELLRALSAAGAAEPAGGAGRASGRAPGSPSAALADRVREVRADDPDPLVRRSREVK